MGSRYDDEIWELVPDEASSPPPELTAFVTALGPAERALDIGCGDGRLTASLRAAAVVATDVSAVALARARERLPGVALVELEPDAPLPFGDCEFDLVLSAETIEHVRDVQLFLSEARRVLRPGATLALTTPAHGRGAAAAVLLLGFGRRLDPRSPHLRFFDRGGLERLLRELGFDEVRIERRRGTLLALATR